MIQKAPHLVKTGPNQAANGTAAAGAVGATDVAAMHAKGLQGLIKQTALEAHTATRKRDEATRRGDTAAADKHEKEREAAMDGLNTIISSYNEASTNPNIDVKPGTDRVMAEVSAAIGAAGPAVPVDTDVDLKDHSVSNMLIGL